MTNEQRFDAYLDSFIEERVKEVQSATRKRFDFINNEDYLKEFTNSFVRCWWEDELFAISLSEQMGLNETHLHSFRNDRKLVALLIDKDFEDCMGF